MMYGSTEDKKRIDDSISVLNYVYSEMPSTKGCLENIGKSKKEGGCGAWCCQVQNPSVLYVEFLNVWKNTISTWSDGKIGNLIEACLKNYLFDRPVKGCVFFDHKSKMCSQHETRPYNCRIYGVIPEEEFKPRYERLKVLNNQTQKQCGLVSTEDGSEVTMKDTNYWWKQAMGAEGAIGIKKSLINDDATGSYRTYHDHVLIHVFGLDFLGQLTDVRLNSSDKEKSKIIKEMMESYKNFMKVVGE